MSLETLIRHRTERKELRLSGELVMTRTAWEQRGGKPALQPYDDDEDIPF